MDDVHNEVNNDPAARNFTTFYGLTPHKPKENVLVVDRGFEGCT